MEIKLERVEAPYHFAATGASDVPVHMDSSPESGGQGAGARPMELLLMGLAGCSGIDVVQILTKQRLNVEDIRISVKGERVKDRLPAVFETIHMHYELVGDLPPEKVKRAIELSMEKYCSASAMLGKTATIDYSFAVAAGKGVPSA